MLRVVKDSLRLMPRGYAFGGSRGPNGEGLPSGCRLNAEMSHGVNR